MPQKVVQRVRNTSEKENATNVDGEARKRRQVIIVTHNANLVVNTDAEQVVVASCEPSQPEKLPLLDYECGSLENPSIRTKVCEILEGGERAFLERERRYRLEWEKMLQDSEPSA